MEDRREESLQGGVREKARWSVCRPAAGWLGFRDRPCVIGSFLISKSMCGAVNVEMSMSVAFFAGNAELKRVVVLAPRRVSTVHGCIHLSIFLWAGAQEGEKVIGDERVLDSRDVVPCDLLQICLFCEDCVAVNPQITISPLSIPQPKEIPTHIRAASSCKRDNHPLPLFGAHTKPMHRTPSQRRATLGRTHNTAGSRLHSRLTHHCTCGQDITLKDHSTLRHDSTLTHDSTLKT